MIRRLALICLLCALVALPAAAQYTTPGLGITWGPDDLVANSGGAVTGSGGQYQVHQLVTISVTDTIIIPAGTVLVFADDDQVGIDVEGALLAQGTATQRIVFTGLNETPGSWQGLHFGDPGPGSEMTLEHCEIAYAVNAADAFGADMTLRSCEIRDSLEKAIDISDGDGLVEDCYVHHNRQRTVSLTLSASPTITGCVFEDNNLDNSSPYPYINIGLQGVNSPTIEGNEIWGSGNHMSGGIAIWNSSNALIQDNRIQGCGYGILCYSVGANPTIEGNLIRDNTIHPDTVNWGFGVACNGDNAPIVTQNVITGHWYGVAAINGGRPNLGDIENDFPGDDGLNTIVGNGLGDACYGFFNNTPLPQMAQQNDWGVVTDEDVEECVQHQVDDPSLGFVNFLPWIHVAQVADTPSVLRDVVASPNPFNPQVTIAFELARDHHATVVILDVRGRLVKELASRDLAAGLHSLRWDGTDRSGRALASGTYFYRVIAGNEASTGKLALVR